MISYVKKIMRIVCWADEICSMHIAHVSCGRQYKKRKGEKKDRESDMKCETWKLLEMQCDCKMYKVNDMKYKTWIMNIIINK